MRALLKHARDIAGDVVGTGWRLAWRLWLGLGPSGAGKIEVGR
jgi:hypothetical protein